MKTNTKALATLLGVLTLAASTGCTGSPEGAATPSGTSAAPAPSATSTAAPADAAASLQYLVEEEKLAHDVYQRFTDLWGAQVFGNIRDSEVMHQQLLVPLLDAKGIVDPRTGTVGTFTDPDIQRLYDQLIQQGTASITEAYKAGVAIEEKDIADLNADLASTTDPATIAVLQRLLAGSRAHLQAFESHLG
ncbi:ferritin-like domain-containing protein [Leifsonia soli]|uniref:DUF2202 domain-containing protein n=1 Tax=Leifsonia soli TaxID=582665 RepID=A0A852T091_9MICO|nr:DUF2202 domain-containing protein [Leifsonia soli]NYD74928.1 hypothetical protein [Leifsonia soli]